jgi:hypothetical protein
MVLAWNIRSCFIFISVIHILDDLPVLVASEPIDLAAVVAANGEAIDEPVIAVSTWQLPKWDFTGPRPPQNASAV